MRCIEIKLLYLIIHIWELININMRCIEITLGRPLTVQSIQD